MQYSVSRPVNRQLSFFSDNYREVQRKFLVNTLVISKKALLITAIFGENCIQTVYTHKYPLSWHLQNDYIMVPFVTSFGTAIVL